MMKPSVRKLLLTAHITVSVGWIGAAVAYLVLVVWAMTGVGDQLLLAAWISMDLIGWYAIVPLAVASLLSGIGIALATPWGLFRHYWVLSSLFLTIVATAVLLGHMPTVSSFAEIAADPAALAATDTLRSALRGELLHAGVGLLVLLAITALNVYKPRGVTAYGRRFSQAAAENHSDDVIPRALGWRSAPGTSPRWVYAVWIHVAVLLVLVAVGHLTGVGLRLH